MTNDTTTTTTHPAHARELARELRKRWAALEADAFRDRGDAAYNFDSYNRNNATAITATLDALADECEKLREERSKLCYQLDHATMAIGYALEAIDGDDVISAHQRLTSVQAIIENADAHKDEWDSYR